MKSSYIVKVLSCAMLFSWLLLPVAVCADDPVTFEIEIEVAPKVLNIESQGEVVTVHTNISYSLVDGATVLLNSVPIDWWKADAQGNFVAKFVMEEIKNLPGLVIGGDNLLTLIGITFDKEQFIGTQSIKVVKIEPKGK